MHHCEGRFAVEWSNIGLPLGVMAVFLALLPLFSAGRSRRARLLLAVAGAVPAFAAGWVLLRLLQEVESWESCSPHTDPNALHIPIPTRALLVGLLTAVAWSVLLASVGYAAIWRSQAERARSKDVDAYRAPAQPGAQSPGSMYAGSMVPPPPPEDWRQGPPPGAQ